MQTMQAAVDDFELELEPLVQAQMLADWDAAIDASDDNERQLVDASKRVDAVLAERERYEQLVEADRSGGVEGELARRVRLARLASEAGQRERVLADRIIESEARLGSLFARHRGQLRGRQVNDNEIAKILRESTDRGERREAWEASKSIGSQVAPVVRELAHLRNEAARALGYRDHFEFALTIDELDETWLMNVLDDLDARLTGTWERTKAAIDDDQRERLGLAASEPLAPWDYADVFFQDAPTSNGDPLEAALEHLDPVQVARDYFLALGDDVDGVLERSDLYPRNGKNQHAFCADIDRRHDVRVLANCEPGTRWLATMVHELGHAVYDLAIDAQLPWLLRQPAHTFTTEAIAMLHGRLVRDETFLERFACVAPEIARDPRNAEMQRREMLVFVHWVQVMTRFERELYRDPEQDLGAVWWRLVERYQRVTPPPGPRPDDWACKLHIALAPVYYQNYLLGEVTASQLAAALARETGAPSPAVEPAAAGEFLRERFMRPGSSMRWDELVEHATGEPLSVDHLAGWLADLR
jgi:peptidyl-dipeptidase A